LVASLLDMSLSSPTLGEIAMFAELARAAVFAAEQGAHEHGNAFWACDLRPLAGLRAVMPMWFPRVNEIIRQTGSHNLLTTPSRAALADSTLRPFIDQYLAGVGVDAEQRAAGCFAWGGISLVLRWQAAMNNTNAFISARSGVT
jgi:aromatic ring hydroxylase